MPDADDLETAAPPVSPQAWQDDAPLRDRPRLPPLPPLPEPAPESVPSRSGRDRLFSTSRRERDRTPPRAAEPSASEARGEVTEVASAGFENAWPKPERARASEPALPRRSTRASSRFTDIGQRGPLGCEHHQIRRRRRDGLFALFRRVDRSPDARGHDAVRHHRRTAGASRQKAIKDIHVSTAVIGSYCIE